MLNDCRDHSFSARAHFVYHSMVFFCNPFISVFYWSRPFLSVVLPSFLALTNQGHDGNDLLIVSVVFCCSVSVGPSNKEVVDQVTISPSLLAEVLGGCASAVI